MKHLPSAQPLKMENATLEQRMEILNWHHKNGKNQTKTAAHFNKIYPSLRLTQPRISAWVKHEVVWQAEYEASRGLSRSVKQIRQTLHPEVTDMLDLWVSKAMADGLLLTGEVLCQKWRTYADMVGVPTDEQLSLSEGWLTWYKLRVGLKQMKRHGEAASAQSDTVNKEQLRLQTLVNSSGYA